MITPEEIVRHVREDCRRYVTANGNDVPEHQADAMADVLLVNALACHLSSAMTCAALASDYFDEKFRERAERQLWNW